MLDLFGVEINSVGTLLNPRHGFDAFWKTFPSHQRKVGKAKCAKMWEAKGYASDATLIADYTRWMTAQTDWKAGFIPMPQTFLNREGWIDWEPETETRAAVEARGIAKGVGKWSETEQFAAYRARVERA